MCHTSVNCNCNDNAFNPLLYGIIMHCRTESVCYHPVSNISSVASVKVFVTASSVMLCSVVCGVKVLVSVMLSHIDPQGCL